MLISKNVKLVLVAAYDKYKHLSPSRNSWRSIVHTLLIESSESSVQHLRQSSTSSATIQQICCKTIGTRIGEENKFIISCYPNRR
jgi:hypothetical protein